MLFRKAGSSGTKKDSTRTYSLWFFKTPDSYFTEGEWRDFDNALWDAVIDREKTAKNLQVPWRETINTIKKYKMEQDLAAVAFQKLHNDANNSESLPLSLVFN